MREFQEDNTDFQAGFAFCAIGARNERRFWSRPARKLLLFSDRLKQETNPKAQYAKKSSSS